MASLAIRCVYCDKPLLDADHAKKHVVNQCESSPTRALADALQAVRALHKTCTATETRDTRCATCKTADTALRAAGRLP